MVAVVVEVVVVLMMMMMAVVVVVVVMMITTMRPARPEEDLRDVKDLFQLQCGPKPPPCILSQPTTYMAWLLLLHTYITS